MCCKSKSAGRPGSGRDVKERGGAAIDDGGGLGNGLGHSCPDQEVGTTLQYTYNSEYVKWEFNRAGIMGAGRPDGPGGQANTWRGEGCPRSADFVIGDAADWEV